ncbi:MAG: glycosyltransferase [Firmicutes bacterium]|nr:glycosyltransferase [Bacillota bacterium]
MIRVHFETPRTFGFSIHRVEKEFKRFAPEDFQFVGRYDIKEADLIIVQFIGRDGLVDYLIEAGKPYVVILYCITPGSNLGNIRSTYDYQMVKNACCTYSFHPLAEMGFAGNLLLGPLGVNPETFYMEPSVERSNTIISTAWVAASEGFQEIYTAAKQSGGKVVHVGCPLTRECGDIFEDAFYIRYENVTDDKLRELYNSCKYVSGLRRSCGFELPVLEGLLCGSRPICFDNPYYTRWFKDLAIFVPETFDHLVEDLVAIFRSDYRPVMQDEIAYVVENFSWHKIAQNFWNFVRQSYTS